MRVYPDAGADAAGLLTYALVEQGLVAGLAAPGAPVLYARPWLSYARATVPALPAGAAAERHLQRPRLYLLERSAFDDSIVARGGRKTN